MATRRLPVIQAGEVESSLLADGRRKKIQPADVRGRFTNWRRVGFALLVAIWIAAPLVQVGGHPAVFLDVQHRRFFLFGASFNSQDVWLTFFLVTGLAFALASTTALLGRVWCGWICPQTVFLDFVFRPIERLFEGPREVRMRRDAAPLGFGKAARKVGKHAAFLVAAFLVAHIALSFFVSVPAVLQMVVSSPGAHPEAFAWACAATLLFYGNFAWFREQLCLIVCPYGRFQAALVDEDSLVIGYDARRGEPRGKAHDAGKGDCVDCKRCVVVCPTGIDIRNGLQLDCVGCTACVDACDEIMDKLHRPRGLVRYDSERGLRGEKRKILRSRLLVYAVLGAVGLAVFTFAASTRRSFEATLLRARGQAYAVDGDTVIDSFSLHLVNKRDTVGRFDVELPSDGGLTFELGPTPIEVPPTSDVRVDVTVRAARKGLREREFKIVIRRDDGETKDVGARFVGPTS